MTHRRARTTTTQSAAPSAAGPKFGPGFFEPCCFAAERPGSGDGGREARNFALVTFWVLRYLQLVGSPTSTWRGAVVLTGALLGVNGCKPATPPSEHPLDAGPPTPACLSIVSWNDLHGQIEPEQAMIDTGRVPAGGVIAVADQIAAIRTSGDTVVVLDAGDMFVGAMASTLAEGAPIVEAYRAMGVDAVAIGNHEFDFGPVGYAVVTAKAGVGDEAGDDGPRGALLARMASAPFPFVSANIRRSEGSPTGWANHRATAHVLRDGFRVGVVGYTTQETPTTTLKPNIVGLDFGGAASGGTTSAGVNVANGIHALRAAGDAPVVLVAHASLDGELPQSLDDPRDPNGVKHTGEIATLLAQLGDDLPDLVIAAHRHAWMLGRVRGVPVVSTDQHGVGIARSRFCREPTTVTNVQAVAGAATTRVKLASIERRVAMASVPPASDLGRRVAEVVAPAEAAVAAAAGAAVAKLTRTCLPQAPAGTGLAELIARAIAEHVGDAALALGSPAGPRPPVVGLINAGGIRAPLLAGDVHFSDVFETFPFENAVALCVTTRGELEHIVKNALDRSGVRERFPFGISGAHAKIKRTAAGGLALAELAISGTARGRGSPADPVWVAMPDFLLGGGDGLLEGVRCAASAGSQTRVRDAFRSLLSREPAACAAAPANVEIEGL